MTTRTLALLLLGAATMASRGLAQEAPAPTPEPTPAPTAAPAPTFTSIKIICDGKVKTDGTATLIFAPAEGPPKEIRVTLQKGMDRKEACRDLTKELQVGLGGLPYAANLYDPDKIKLTGQKGAKFGLALGTQTATGFTILLK